MQAPLPSDLSSQLAESIRAAIDASAVVLFGSRARGEARVDSDVDLLVVAERAAWREPSRAAEAGRLRRALPRIGLPFDVLLHTPREVARWRLTTNHVIATAMAEGEILYERPGAREGDARTRSR